MNESTGSRRDPNGAAFVCEICGATFGSDESLRRHLNEAGLVT